MEANFAFDGNYVKIFDFFYDGIEWSPFDTSFKVSVLSNGFAGEGPWECGIESFRAFVDALEGMHHLRAARAELNSFSYDSHISFVLDHLGHICVSGTLFGPHEDQHVTFEFTADQTILDPFIKGLQQLLP